MNEIFISFFIAVWFVIGMWQVRTHENGWLIMMSDSRNVKNTWLVFPALFFCWALWPFRDLSMHMFHTMWRLGL
jgi:hypothetical protein